MRKEFNKFNFQTVCENKKTPWLEIVKTPAFWAIIALNFGKYINYIDLDFEKSD